MEPHTEILCNLIERFAPNGNGVEIGINRGSTSVYIMEHTSTRHLYMVDPWMWNYDEKQGLYSTKHDPDKDCEYVTQYFADKFPKKHTIIRKKSKDATNDVPNNLDFIFIDGNHTYEYVMKDLELWVPKIKSNGLIMGHDWWSKFPDVEKAVVAFCNKYKGFLPPDHEIEGHIPAPSSSPVVMKSWPKGHLWWAIKKR